MHEGIMGWDVGGAHLKAAFLAPDDAVQEIIHLPCPLWRGLAHLEQAMVQVAAVGGSETLPINGAAQDCKYHVDDRHAEH